MIKIWNNRCLEKIGYTSNYRKQAVDNIQKLKEGEVKYLPIVYQIFASGDGCSMQLAARAIREFMAQLNSAQVIRLDGQFRQYTSMEWSVDWEKVSLPKVSKKINNPEDFLYVLRLGTFHPNGYFREKCLMLLETDTASLSYLILRMNDWVYPIRKYIGDVIEAMLDQAPAEALLGVLPFLRTVKQKERKDTEIFCRIENGIARRLKEEMKSVSPHRLKSVDAAAKRYFYGLLLNQNCLSKMELETFLDRETNSACKSLLIRSLLEKYPCGEEQLERYLQNKSVVVRKIALEQKYLRRGDYWPGIEQMLLDNARGIRELAAYIVNTHTKIEVITFYAAHLGTEFTNTSILGIGENGTESDASLILEYLEDDTEKTVRNTVKTLGILLGSKSEKILWEHLQDKRTAIVKTAYLAARRNEIRYGSERLYHAFLQCDNPVNRKYFIYLLLSEPSWLRLPYLLLLYHYEDKTLQDSIRKKAYKRDTYGKVSSENAAQIMEIIRNSSYRVPDKLAAEIEFDLKHL